MSILQFVRIVWAYKYLALASTILFTLIAIVTVQVVEPRYVAQSRVMLDVIKPDPVTGQVMSTAFLRAYTKTQIELVKEQQVARRVVEDLGWEKDPAMQRAYRNRSGQRDLDFSRWAAQVIMKGADARLIEGSNILEISYTSSNPSRAKTVADGLRKAYVEMTLQSRREAARRNADWYEAQAEKSKSILFKAEMDKANFERDNGILLTQDKVDLDSARLAALASQGVAPVISAGVAVNAPSAGSLAQVEAELEQASKVLGPNHPQLKALQARQQLLEKQVASERNAAASAASTAMSAAQATSGLLEAQKAKVMSQRDKVERVRLMQDEIDLRRDQYTKGIARAAQLRQEAEIAEAGVTPLASAITPQSPVFPKKGLIVGASIFAGIGAGIALGLLIELFGRRVRSADDLEGLVEAPVLAVIRSRVKPSKRGFKLPLPGALRARAARA
jgi:uncharacterized protein involved in exopolysaccharide biosynthesis